MLQTENLLEEIILDVFIMQLFCLLSITSVYLLFYYCRYLIFLPWIVNQNQRIWRVDRVLMLYGVHFLEWISF